MTVTSNQTPSMRIGQGWDIHTLIEGRPLILGGISIAHKKGLLGHSDGDALLHAIIDALLGAARLGDIGTYFPDNDAAYKGANSVLLLKETGRKVFDSGFVIGNIDSTVIAQAPRLSPYISLMQESIASALAIDPKRVNVKAKTAEHLGPIGQGMAISAQAVTLLWSR